MELVVESAEPEPGIRRGWFRLTGVPADVELTFECELGYTFDPVVWGQGFAGRRVAFVTERDLLRLPYAVSAIRCSLLLPGDVTTRRRARIRREGLDDATLCAKDERCRPWRGCPRARGHNFGHSDKLIY